MPDAEDFIQAIEKNDAAKVRELLAGDPNLILTKTRDGSLVLTAAYHGAKDALKAILPRFPKLNIYEAAVVGDAERLRQILDEGPELVNSENHDGFSPLGLAAFFGQPRAVKLLLAHGAEVDMVPKSRFGNTALDAAVAGNHTEVVRALLGARASVNVTSEGGHTPLHKAAMHGNLEIVKLLLDHGADANARAENGKTPLDCAVEKGHGAVEELLRARTP